MQPSLVHSDGSMSGMMGGMMSMPAPQQPRGHPFHAMSFHAAAIHSQGSGSSSFSASPSAQSQRSLNPFLMAAVQRTGGSMQGGDMFARSSAPIYNLSGGNAGGSMLGPSPGSMNLGSPGFILSAPGPAPTARRRRASLDSSCLPPMPTAQGMGMPSGPSMGMPLAQSMSGTPFAGHLDLVCAFRLDLPILCY